MRPKEIPIPLGYHSTILRTAKHEAGHYIVGRALGFDFGALTIKFTDLDGGHEAGAAIYLAQPVLDTAGIMDYLERRVQVLYAGVLAESLDAVGKVQFPLALRYIGVSAKDDHSKVRELANLLRNLRFPASERAEADAQLNESDLDLWNRAAVVVEREHEYIVGLANRLASEVKVLGKAYSISEAELKSLPSLVKRFPPGTPQSPEQPAPTTPVPTMSSTPEIKRAVKKSKRRKLR